MSSKNSTWQTKMSAAPVDGVIFPNKKSRYIVYIERAIYMVDRVILSALHENVQVQ